jgi:hypothetical protein
MLTLVVARYNEDVSWVNLIPANVVIVNKSAIGNTGREAASYLWYIARHYHALEGDYLFCQGDPFAHCPDFVEQVRGWVGGHRPPLQGLQERHFGVRLVCDWNGAPHHPGLDLERGWEVVQENVVGTLRKPAQIEFTAGAQFLRSADEIKRAVHAVDCEALLRLLEQHEELELPWVLERLWDYLIPRKNDEGGMKQ